MIMRLRLPYTHQFVAVDVPDGTSKLEALNIYYKNNPAQIPDIPDTPLEDEQTIRNIASHNLEHDIERIIINAATAGINLNEIANVLQNEANTMRRVYRMVRNLHGRDTWT